MSHCCLIANAASAAQWQATVDTRLQTIADKLDSLSPTARSSPEPNFAQHEQAGVASSHHSHDAAPAQQEQALAEERLQHRGTAASDHETTLQALRGRVTALEHASHPAPRSISSAQQQISALEGRVNTMVAEQAALQQSLAHLSERNSVLEAAFAKMLAPPQTARPTRPPAQACSLREHAVGRAWPEVSIPSPVSPSAGEGSPRSRQLGRDWPAGLTEPDVPPAAIQHTSNGTDSGAMVTGSLRTDSVVTDDCRAPLPWAAGEHVGSPVIASAPATDRLEQDVMQMKSRLSGVEAELIKVSAGVAAQHMSAPQQEMQAIRQSVGNVQAGLAALEHTFLTQMQPGKQQPCLAADAAGRDASQSAILQLHNQVAQLSERLADVQNVAGAQGRAASNGASATDDAAEAALVMQLEHLQSTTSAMTQRLDGLLSDVAVLRSTDTKAAAEASTARAVMMGEHHQLRCDVLDMRAQLDECLQHVAQLRESAAAAQQSSSDPDEMVILAGTTREEQLQVQLEIAKLEQKLNVLIADVSTVAAHTPAAGIAASASIITAESEEWNEVRFLALHTVWPCTACLIMLSGKRRCLLSSDASDTQLQALAISESL
jgi:chromosome segregation ATPase